MKYCIPLLLLNLFCIAAFCQNKRSAAWYTVPDSVKATGFYAELKLPEKSDSKKLAYGISINEAILSLGYNKEQKVINFSFFVKPGKDIAFGKEVYQYEPGNAWNYEWNNNETYPLLILTASDSASNTTLYSGYIFLPKEKKWKFIATRSFNDTNLVKYIWAEKSAREKSDITYSNRWLLRGNNTWKALDSQTTKPPSLRQMSNIDSVVQQKTEEALLRARLKDSAVYEAGMFYQTLKEGTGRLVKVSDTLTVHYRGSLYSDGSVFDETNDKPATFPLERLIKGWQIGLVHCKMGGKMRLYLPSGSAYGIRTRSAEIPPNSILVFDVEVLDAKEKITK